MITFKLNLIVSACLALFIGASSIEAAPATLREVEMDTYRVISSAPKKEIVKWVKEFESMRLLAKRLTGISDEQVLPLTIILLEYDDEFEDLLPNQAYDYTQTLVMSVGMNQQPLMAMSLSGMGRDPQRETKIRSSLIMWMMSSSGLSYDPWVVQGMIDLLGSATLSTRKVVLGKGVRYYRDVLKNTAMLAPGRQFYLDQGTLHTGYAWGALHYITLRNRKWAGMDKITQYQRLIRIGTPREEAFTEAFGVTSAKMDVLIQKYLAKDRFKTVNLAPMKEIPDSKIVVKRAEPGQWELGQARLVTQQGPLDSALAQRLLDKAQELRPDDPAVYETLWLYKAKSGEAAAAFEYLLKARELGSENHAVRLQWSIDLINQNIAKTRGFIIPDKDAAQAADDLMQMEAAIPGRLLVYRLHAQMITSLTQPRTQDREFIENAIAMVHTADPVLETGLAAWYWRNGQMDKANAHLTKSNYEVNDVQFIRFFGDWVRSQIEAQQSLDEIDGVLRDRDYETVKELYGYIPRNYALTPALKERTEAIATELKQFDFLMTIQERLDAGEKEAARLLIQSMDGLEMSENLEKIGEDLRKRL